MTRMAALLLAAGLGTRLRPLTDVLPKCLMPVSGRPLLEYWLRLLQGAEIDRILVNLHHHASLVREFLANSPLSSKVTTVYEPELLGTGGTVLANQAFLRDGPVLVAHADNITKFSVRELLAAHAVRPSGSEITMMTFATPNPQDCGIVEVSSSGIVTAFHEKVPDPPGNLANAAVYVLEPSVIEFLASLGKSVIDISTEVLPRYIGRMSAWHNTNYHRDIGTLHRLLMAQFEFPLAAFRSVSRCDAGDPENPWLQDGAMAAQFLRALDDALVEASPPGNPEL